MSKQLVRVVIQTILKSLSEICCTSQFVYRIYTRGAKHDPTPHCKSLKFVKDSKGVRLNGEV